MYGVSLMIEIYKKLPKTNCGKCGVSTCMAFAQKVKKAESKLSDCPYIDKDIAQDEQTTGSPEAFSNYAQVSDDLEKEATSVDFREAAKAIGGVYESNDGRDTIKLIMINTPYELRKDGLFKNNVYCSDPWTKIIIYDYVHRKGVSPLTGDWITLGHFPHTASHVKAFQSNAEKKIAETFKNDLPGLKRNCTYLGGVEAESRAKSDYFCSVPLLPRVPLYLSFWRADEEFGAECKLLFDSNAEDHIDIEYLASLLEMFVNELVGEG
jgi:hypothetical protein